jgi:hypothetical protein
MAGPVAFPPVLPQPPRAGDSPQGATSNGRGRRAALWRRAAPVVTVALVGLVLWQASLALPEGDVLAGLRSGWALVAAAVSYALVLLLLPVLWAGLLRSVLRGVPGDTGTGDTGTGDAGPGTAPLALTDLYLTYSRSWLARYIPGRVWTYGGRALLAARLGVPLGPVAGSMVLEILFSYGMLTVLGAALLAGAAWSPAAGVTILAAGVAALGLGIGVLLARTRRIGRDRAARGRTLPARLARHLPETPPMPPGAIALAIAAYAAHGGLNLLFLVFATLAFVDLDTAGLVHVAGAWGVAMTLGWLAFLAPGGLGARDGIALLFMAQVMDAPDAALIVAATRILGVALDVLFVGAVEVVVLAARLTRHLQRALHPHRPASPPVPPQT